jgi:hypothetical protein
MTEEEIFKSMDELKLKLKPLLTKYSRKAYPYDKEKMRIFYCTTLLEIFVEVVDDMLPNKTRKLEFTEWMFALVKKRLGYDLLMSDDK